MHAKRDVFHLFILQACCHCWVTPGPLTVKEEKKEKEVKASSESALSMYYLKLEFYHVTHVGRFSIIHNWWNQTCETGRDSLMRPMCGFECSSGGYLKSINLYCKIRHDWIIISLKQQLCFYFFFLEMWNKY